MSGLHRSSSPPLKNGHPPQELLDDLCSCDVLRPYVAHIDDLFKDFTDYKVRVPVTGAIILDKTYELCILVKGWKGTSWSFPRGKKNKDEEDHACAIREVLEETGFDVSGLLNKDEYIEVIFGQQRVRLYIISGVKDDTAFAPLTKKEISIFKIMGFKAFSPSTSKIRFAPKSKPLIQLVKLGTGHCYGSVSGAWICVWKANNSSTGSNSSPSTKFTSNANSIDTGPGKSFRNFRFDSAAILRALEAGFSA
ncbi:hypothetical protein V6N11_055055 [Hibiscus sabdariffa]|uniref:Nudix hydrolase domain-containing protein n=1 Tax=Hibiscus sabdariffa TaxID=183260 RepID=A0ABR1ZAZ8_9ROSI